MEDINDVKLHVYDLSQGLAKQMSMGLLGEQIDGIWHTGIVVYGHEYFWGGYIAKDLPGRTPYGMPTRIVTLGKTYIPQEVFEEFVNELRPRFTPETYHLLSHNCNNFTSEASQFLTGKDIPSDIVGLPDRVLRTPLGQMLQPMIIQLENSIKSQISGDYAAPSAPSVPLANAIKQNEQEEKEIGKGKEKDPKQQYAYVGPNPSFKHKPMLSVAGSAVEFGGMIPEGDLSDIDIEKLKELCVYIDISKKKRVKPKIRKTATSVNVNESGIEALLGVLCLPTLHPNSDLLLQILRLLLLRKEAIELIVSTPDMAKMLETSLNNCLTSKQEKMELLALSCCSNIFSNDSGKLFMLKQPSILTNCLSKLHDSSIVLKLMSSSVCYNMLFSISKFENECMDMEPLSTECIIAILESLYDFTSRTEKTGKEKESTEIVYRLLIGLCCASSIESIKTLLLELDFPTTLHGIRSLIDEGRIMTLTDELTSILS